VIPLQRARRADAAREQRYERSDNREPH
jgi:hypothetical protein